MAKEFGGGKNFTFLKLNAKGELFVGSKEQKDGYEEVTLKNGDKTYQKSYKSTDYGKVIFLGINEKNFDSGKVKYVELSIASDEVENSVDVVQLPLRNAKGGLTDEVKKLIAILPSLDYSKSIVISSNREKNDRGYVDKLLYFRYKAEEGEEKDPTIKFSLRFGEKGNIPMFTVEEDPITPGSKTFNYKEQDAFLAKVLVSEIKRFEDFKSGNVYQSENFKEWVKDEGEVTATTPVTEQSSVATPKAEENPFATKAVEEDNDSPF